MTKIKIPDNSVAYEAEDYKFYNQINPTKTQNIFYSIGTALQAASLGLLSFVLANEFNIASDIFTNAIKVGIPVTAHMGGTLLRALMKEEFRNSANLAEARKLACGNEKEANRIAKTEHFPTLFVKELGGIITDFIPKRFKPA